MAVRSTQFDPSDYGMSLEATAHALAGLAYELIQPLSVVDVGCGPGVFLSEFSAQGVEDVQGVDGEPASRVFLLGAECFTIADIAQPLDLGRRFDLAVCLEVGEHLPLSAGSTLVASLVDLAPVVVFSAAFPGQGGQNHINEQWPWWWQRLFMNHHYVCLDILRGRLFGESEVVDCYRTNPLVFAELEAAERIADRASELTPDAFILSKQAGFKAELLHQPMALLGKTMLAKLARGFGALRGTGGPIAHIR